MCREIQLLLDPDNSCHRIQITIDINEGNYCCASCVKLPLSIWRCIYRFFCCVMATNISPKCVEELSIYCHRSEIKLLFMCNSISAPDMAVSSSICFYAERTTFCPDDVSRYSCPCTRKHPRKKSFCLFHLLWGKLRQSLRWKLPPAYYVLNCWLNGQYCFILCVTSNKWSFNTQKNNFWV